LDDIDCFAISAGPGSFTGLRIGIAAIKGLAYALNKPCVSVSTLEALAYNLISIDGVICAAMDARCNQVYTATFSGNDNQILRLTDDQAIKIDDLGQQLKKLNQKVFFVGDGASLCFKKLSTEIDCRLANETRLFERASSVAFVALEKIKRNETISADDLMPIYLRLPQAQRELEAKNTAAQSGL
ncbi:MAG: tRNA (adenosine(37)-N6)-threonylcarbamoyltransferase complex dimerization subunit type 1 TsaB, partial [Oscillospiraceae bacterium]